MAHLLTKKISLIGRRARLHWVLHGLSVAISIVLALALCLIAIDYLLRFEDSGIRVMATSVLAVAMVWVIHRFVWLPLSAPLSPLEIALRLERRFPQLSDRLASSMEFLAQTSNDQRAGSAELRRAAIHQTSQVLENLDLGQAIDRRPARRALAVALMILLAAITICAISPQLAIVGVRRLINPLNPIAWPQQNHLALRTAVQKLAAGQAFEVEVIDSNRLPEEVWMIYRHLQADGSYTEERQLLPVVSGAAIAHRDHVTRPFAYRAIGGDDRTMPWTLVRILDPPALTAVNVILHFPKYTGWPDRPSDKQLRAIVGTHVAIEATANKPLRSAKIVYEDGREVPLTLAADRLHLSLPWDAATPMVVDKTGAYSFLLEDTSGLQSSSDVHYEMRALPDLEPSVTLDAPPATTYVTPRSIIPLHVTVTDDLAIRDIELRFLRSDQSDRGDQGFSLYQGPDTPNPPEPTAAQSGEKQGERRIAEFRWELARLQLSPGVQLTVHAAATDYRPATGRSITRQIMIVAPEELERRLEDREASLLAELNHVLKLEQGSRAHVAALQIQTEQVGAVEQADRDRLHAAALMQRQVDRALAGRDEGVPSQLAGLIADIANNQLDNPELKRRTEAMLAELTRLERHELARIEPALTTAEKSLKSAPADRVPADVGRSIKEAAQNQDSVIASLERLLGELSQWDSHRRLVRDLADLQQAQQKMAERTSEIGRSTLSKSISQLTAQQQADLKKLAAEQRDLARRFEATQQAMARARRQMDQQNPLDAQAVADALAKAGERAIAGKMHESGSNIEQNQIGQAGANQKQAAEDLDELLDILSNRREHELSRLVKKLKEAEAELQSVRAQQAGLRKRLSELAKQSDSPEKRQQLQRLAREQQQLREAAARMARKLARLQAERSSASVAQAAERMGQASQQDEQNQAQEASESADQAQKDLDEAQNQLAERRRQAERDLAFEQFAKIRDSIVALRDRQHKAIDETKRIDGLRRGSGELSRAQSESLLAAAKSQELLSSESLALAQRLSAADAFALAMNSAGRDMADAAARLKNRETGAPAREPQERALRRLEQLLTALVPEKNRDADKQDSQQGEGGAGAPAEGPPGEQIPEVAQLKLVKLMQEDLNQRTSELAASDASEEKVATAIASLGAEQGRLADVIRNLSADAQHESNQDDIDLQQLLEGKTPSKPGLPNEASEPDQP